jgi:4-diphosphocytidyl-2-C-methyl-D-erythritol kinase
MCALVGQTMGVPIFSPAKLNLYLAVTGRRTDGFHDLVSLAALVEFGDELNADLPYPGRDGGYTLRCDDPAIPVDGTNLILKAAHAFARATGWNKAVDFRLNKRIPMGAGLGGGSSNAAAALRALNDLSGGLADEAQLSELAASLGSDCAMFLQQAPVVMRGRGERVEHLPIAAVERLRGQRVLLFKPSFGISTPWAYARMASGNPRYYLAETKAEARLANWLAGSAPVAGLLFNNMQEVAFDKFVALPVLLATLRQEFGVAVQMSGSGSACFALLDGVAPEVVTQMKQRICQCWGASVFVQETRIA